MKLWETFDLTSLAVGLLIGAIAALLLRLQALKRLSLDMKKIGLSLGVEGFDEKPTGFHIGGNVGGDVAGRDMKKDMRDQSQNVMKQLAANLGTHVERRESIRVETSDSRFKTTLQNLSKEGGDWTSRWINLCRTRPEFRKPIDEKIEELKAGGWVVHRIGFDNHGAGLHVNFECRKRYDPDAPI